MRARLSSDWIETTGAAPHLRRGPRRTPTSPPGRRFALNFWDANSTKALHIGHLRNLALGNALGSALSEAGGKVERRSIICDVGRSMGEAMAGVVKSGRHTQSSLEGGEKSDHFVGACYAEYVKSGPSLTGRDDNPASSLTRELDVHHDSADELLQRVLDGDQDAIELWSKTRAWVISGQRKTLARLGISFDRVFFESDFLPEVAELSEPRVGARDAATPPRRRGHLPDRPRGAGGNAAAARRRPADPAHAGARLLDGGAGPRRYDLDPGLRARVGRPRHLPRQLMDEMMAKGAGADINHPAHDVFHGMVSKQSESVSSSKKNALLIDELAEWIDAAMELEEERVVVRERHPAAEAIVPQVALGYFLMHTNTKPLDFEPEKLLREEQSLGWDLARARAHNGNGSGTATAEPAQDPELPLRRRAVGDVPAPPAAGG